MSLGVVIGYVIKCGWLQYTWNILKKYYPILIPGHEWSEYPMLLTKRPATPTV